MPNLIVGLVLALGVIIDANAIAGNTCAQMVCAPDDEGYMDINRITGCLFTSSTCWGDGSRLLSCMMCSDGYTETEKTATIPCSGGTMRYTACQEDCTGCTNCTSDTSWSAGNTGYEKKVTRTCNCNTCVSSTSYRCAAGYYGSSINGTSGCSKCSSHNSVAANSSAGSTAQTSCYI